jgi:hypothetical protein
VFKSVFFQRNIKWGFNCIWTSLYVCMYVCMYVWGMGHKVQPLHCDLQWSIVFMWTSFISSWAIVKFYSCWKKIYYYEEIYGLWSKMVLEKLIVSHLGKKFRSFTERGGSSTVLIRSHSWNCILNEMNPVHIIPSIFSKVFPNIYSPIYGYAFYVVLAFLNKIYYLFPISFIHISTYPCGMS